MKNIKLFVVLIFLSYRGSLAQIEAFSNEYISQLMDSLVFNNMEKYHVPGAGYAVVKGSQIVHVGYKGLADMEKQKPVNSQTRFMLGSIAKLFTTVGVMQLYEQRKVELDIDINTYLKSFQLPYKVTLRQLLTHTAGLEERVFDRIKRSSEELQPLKNYLQNHLPEQILSPGKYPAYSNHGMALAGLIVQEVSGLPFEDYIQKHIFIPLGMKNSTFRLNDRSKTHLAASYLSKGGKLKKAKLEYVQTIPASMLISTPADMSKFMCFVLNPEPYEVLKPKTMKEMQSLQYTPHAKLWGRGFGFFQQNYRGVRILEHGGSRNGFYGQISFSKKDSIGVFVIQNGGNSNFRTAVTFGFLGSIYPKVDRAKKFDNQKININEYIGTYLSNRRIESSFGKLILQATFVEKIEVEPFDKNSLKLFGSTYKAQSVDQFEISSDSTLSFPIAFGRNELGQVQDLYLSGRSDSLRKMAWYENEWVGVITFVVAVLIFLVVTIVDLVRIRKEEDHINDKSRILQFGFNKLVYSTLNLTFLISLIVLLMVSGESLQYELPALLYPIFSLAIIAFLPLILMLYKLISDWQNLKGRMKLANSLFVLASLFYTWQLFFWNFIGFNF